MKTPQCAGVVWNVEFMALEKTSDFSNGETAPIFLLEKDLTEKIAMTQCVGILRSAGVTEMFVSVLPITMLSTIRRILRNRYSGYT